MNGVNLSDKFNQFDEFYAPKIISKYNGNEVCIVKCLGEFPWHTHEDTDDLFLVIKGEIVIRMHEGNVHLKAGELFVVPAGVAHSPYAEKEAHVMLIEPQGEPNTGEVKTATQKVEI